MDESGFQCLGRVRGSIWRGRSSLRFVTMTLALAEPFRLFYQSGNEHDMGDRSA
jgi:hypothetical protein